MRAVPLLPRLYSKFERPEGKCWQWTGTLNKSRGGYGFFWMDGKQRSAHRVVYEVLVGPIPAGMTLDHLCRNKGCVNPDHLEPVTAVENQRRWCESRTHCPNGHALLGRNVWIRPATGSRHCRACRVEATRRWRQRAVA